MRNTGRCPVCARQVGLTPIRGVIKTHVTRGERCLGMGLEPVTGSVDSQAAVAAPEGFAAGWYETAVRQEPAGGSHAGKIAVGIVAAVVAALVASAVWDIQPSDDAASDDSSVYESDVYADADSSVAPETDGAYGLPVSVVEETFLSTIHDSGLSMYGPDDQQIELAHAMCGALDRGAAFEDAMDVLMAAGYGSDAAGAYYGIAVASFCPQHSTW